MRFLKDFKRCGSILFVSHDLGSVVGLCDRAIWLDRGLIRAEGPAVTVCEQYVASLFDPQAEAAEVVAQAMHAAPIVKEFDDEIILYDGTPRPGRAPGVTACSAFNPEGSGFGNGGAAIVDAGLVDPATERALDQVKEGQEVDLRIVGRADSAVARPIFGFYIKDKLGQLLLGDNTYRTDAPQTPMKPGEKLAARFRFRWPALAAGPYTLTVGLADGTMEHHIMRHWLHDAVIFEVLSSSATLALVGLPITRVSLERKSAS
jgi:lipopolysaccharide transport system ATP-binding protein